MENWDKLNTYFTEEELNQLIAMDDLPKKALIIIRKVYQDKKDLSGNPECWHFIAVGDAFEDEERKTVGYLHDIVEDGYITFKDLLLVGFPVPIVNTLRILNYDKSVFKSYEEYITNIIDSNDIKALDVKNADMLHNLSRMSALEESERIHRENKYHKQRPRIVEKIGEIT